MTNKFQKITDDAVSEFKYNPPQLDYKTPMTRELERVGQAAAHQRNKGESADSTIATGHARDGFIPVAAPARKRRESATPDFILVIVLPLAFLALLIFGLIAGAG